MDRVQALAFHRRLKTFDDFHHLLYFLKVQCAPTTSGLKVATMLNLTKTEKPLYDIWKIYSGEILRILGLKAFLLKETAHSGLIIFYRRNLLEKHLKQPSVSEFLKEFGYDSYESPEEYLLALRMRFVDRCPNEVGVFLGYPLEDVWSFHCTGGKKCLATGYWRCYHNVDESLAKFRLFDETRRREMERILSR